MRISRKLNRAGALRSRRGFSLVVSLVMMALMLLVAIALVSFVFVQSKLTESKLKMAQARINAVAGMRVALGQLQLLTGDDQRVTATGDIFGDGDNASLPSGSAVNGKRFWTGVWATGGLDKEKIRDWSVYSPDKKPFLGWLVSDYDSSKEVFSPNEKPIAKATASSQSTSLLNVVLSDFNVDDEKLDLVTLVGAGSLGDGKDAAGTLSFNERTVKVRRVPLVKYSAASTETIRPTTGAFAYWVGDEGVKARVNIENAFDEKFLQKDWEKMFSSTTAARLGVAEMTGLQNFDTWWERDLGSASKTGMTTLPYVDSPTALAVYASSQSTETAEYARQLFHDVSFSSNGIFTDIYNGGLKTDLSIAFEMPWFSSGDWKKGFRDIKQFHGSGEKNTLNFTYTDVKNKVNERTKWWVEQPADGLGFLFEIRTNESGSKNGRPDHDYVRGPTWDLVRNYYRLYKREDENVGFRGFTAHSKDAWIAVGSVPYSYLSPIGTQTNGTSGGGGPLGDKANAGLFVTRNYNANYVKSALLTEIDGKSRLWDSSWARTPMIIPQSMVIAPVVQRIAFRYAIGIGENNTVRFLVDPVLTIHNPYNVPLEFFGFGAYWQKYQPFDLILTRTDTDDNGNAKTWSNGSTTFRTDRVFNYYTRFTYRTYAGTVSLNQGASGYEVLQPGEVRTYLPASAINAGINQDITTRQLGSYKSSDWDPARTGLVSSQSLGITVTADDLTKGVNFDCEIAAYDSSSSGDESVFPREPDLFSFNLFYPRSASGDNMENSPESVQRIWRCNQNIGDASDENLTSVFAMRRWHRSDGGTIKANKTIQISAAGEKEYVMLMDVYRQGSSETPLAGPLVTNPRAQAIFPYSFDQNLAKRAIDIGWTREVDDDDGNVWPQRLTMSRWGDDVLEGGQSNVVLFEIPQRPLLSLGQLQHVDCSFLNTYPGYVVANSYAPIGISDQEKVFSWSGSDFVNSGATTQDTSALEVQPRADFPFAANLALFDRYFFSGINFQGTIGEKYSDQPKGMADFIDKAFSTDLSKNPFPNKRVSLIRDFGDRKESEVKQDFYDPEKVARDLMFSGTFNVNSTSVEAWKAVLSGLRGQLINLDGEFEDAGKKSVFLRFMNTIGRKLGGYSARDDQPDKDGDGDDGNGWRWYLENIDVDKLAEAIVKQVRMRGPFMSMSDFVNRRLVSGDTGRAGALQAAIDDAGINNEYNGASNPDSARFKHLYPGTSGKISEKAGAPGYLMQGDVLSNVGAGLAARSDTFTIRAYGDVSGVTGVPEARAWCEAVVQRMPEFFDPQDDENDTIIDVSKFIENYRSQSGESNRNLLDKFERNSKLSSVNKLFGRRYKIISFRWLSQDEI